MPADLQRWESQERAATRQTALQLLGEMPARPRPVAARITRREDRGDHFAETFELRDGAEAVIPGLVLIPKHRAARVPAIVALHAWSGDKDSLLTAVKDFDELVGPPLVKAGYVVAAIDGAFHGDRIGRGPNDRRESTGGKSGNVKQRQQQALFAWHLWQGRTLWGMMLRDQQLLLDYLQTRAEVDADRIGATGISLGNTTGWWLAAIDERVKAVVGVCCFTRLQEFIQQGYIAHHGLYYYVPNMLRHFDTEAIFALVAPRPLLQLNGDSDPTCPVDGIAVLEQKLGDFYRRHGQPDRFHSVVYQDTGHIYLPDMKRRMVQWFEQHLPPPGRAP
jgi:dienelactone hydrolase